MNTPKNDNNDPQIPPEVVDLVNNLFASKAADPDFSPNVSERRAKTTHPRAADESLASPAGRNMPDLLAPRSAASGNVRPKMDNVTAPPPGATPDTTPSTEGDALHAILARGEKPTVAELIERGTLPQAAVDAVREEFPELFGGEHPRASNVDTILAEDDSSGPDMQVFEFESDNKDDIATIKSILENPPATANEMRQRIQDAPLPEHTKTRLIKMLGGGDVGIQVVKLDDNDGPNAPNGMLRHDFRDVLKKKMELAGMSSHFVNDILNKFDADLAAGRVTLAPPPVDSEYPPTFSNVTIERREHLHGADGKTVTHSVHASATSPMGNLDKFTKEQMLSIISTITSITATIAGNIPRTQAKQLMQHLNTHRDEFLKSLKDDSDDISKADHADAVERAFGLVNAALTIADTECVKGRPAMIDPQPCTINSLLVLLDVSGLVAKHGALTEESKSDVIDSLCEAVEMHNAASGVTTAFTDIDRQRRREAVTRYVTERIKAGSPVTFDGADNCHKLPNDDETPSFDTFSAGPIHRRH